MAPQTSNPDTTPGQAIKTAMNPFDKVLDALCLTPVAVAGLVILVLLPLIPPFNQEYMIRWLVAAALIAAGSIAFDFTAGFINIVNFGFYAILGLGGYTSAILAANLGVSPWIGIWCGALAAAILGFLTGLLTLRLRGIFAAVMAWFVGLALMGLCTKLVWLTRGPLGLRVPRLFETNSNIPYYYLILVMMFALNPWLAAGSMIVFPLMLWVVGYVGKRTRKGYREFQMRIGQLNGQLEEMFSGQRVITAFGQQANVLTKFSRANEAARVVGTHAQTYSMLIPPLMGILSNANIAIVAGLGGWMTLNG